MLREDQIPKTLKKPGPHKCAIDYYYNGKLQSFQCRADSWEDAKARLEAIRETAWVEGFPVYTIPVPLSDSTPKLVLHAMGNILARIVAWVNGKHR